MGEEEEDALRREFHCGKSEISSYFCYLIIDPTMLPDVERCSFRQFVRSVFYVGKGNRSRPLQHLVDAYRHRWRLLTDPLRAVSLESISLPASLIPLSCQTSEKLRRILALWDAGHGVISVHIAHNIHSREAYAREAAMIEAIGMVFHNVYKCFHYHLSSFFRDRESNEHREGEYQEPSEDMDQEAAVGGWSLHASITPAPLN